MKMSDRLFKYGIGTGHVFEYDREATEEENYRRLDLLHCKAYFAEQTMIFDMKK